MILIGPAFNLYGLFCYDSNGPLPELFISRVDVPIEALAPIAQIQHAAAAKELSPESICKLAVKR